jgi:CPA2 family monovalent cation:H+ antiporter-2
MVEVELLHSEVFFSFLITSISMTVVVTLLSKVKVPTIVGFIITGIIIGPYGLNWIDSIPATNTISELGIIFLMFVLGVEISFSNLKSMLKPLLKIGGMQVGITIVFATALFYISFHFPIKKSFLFSACLALSSTAMVLKILHERRETETPHGRVGVLILLFQDIIALPLMISVPLLAASESVKELGIIETFIGISSFLVGSFLFGKYALPKIFNEVTKSSSREIFFLLVFSFTFVLAFLAEKVGLTLSLGAFIAGVLISESKFSKQAIAELSPLRDIFLGFFFTSIGMLLNFEFIMSHFGKIIWIAPTLFLLKFSIIYFIVKTNSNSHGISFSSALMLSQIGEFSFVLGTLALNYKLISEMDFQYFLTLSVFSLILTPYFANYALRTVGHKGWSDLTFTLKGILTKPKNDEIYKISPVKPEIFIAPRKAIVIGLGHSGINTLLALQKNSIPCVGIDFNPLLLEAAQEKGLEVIYGDASKLEVLEAAGIRESYLVVISVSGKHLITNVLSMVKKHCPRIKIILRVHYLLEASEMAEVDKDQIIISEVEATHAIVKKTLSEYNLYV